MQDDLERWIVRLFNTGQKHKFYECNEWRALEWNNDKRGI